MSAVLEKAQTFEDYLVIPDSEIDERIQLTPRELRNALSFSAIRDRR